MTQIKVRENGPLLVVGDDVTLIDTEGKAYPTAGPTMALCRCGASGNKPFCDGAHNAAGFIAVSTAPD
jgi:CDGSH-type Zn-finger protein